MRRTAWMLASVSVLAGLLWGTWRVVALEREELDHWSAPVRLVPTREAGAAGEGAPHRELGRVTLRAGETVTVEVCADDRLEPRRWAPGGVELALWIPSKRQVVARRRLDEAGLADVARTDRRACLVLARGGDLVAGGEYAVEAVWAGGDLDTALGQVPFQVHVMAFRPARASERWPVVVVLAGMLLVVLVSSAPARRPLSMDRDDVGAAPQAEASGVALDGPDTTGPPPRQATLRVALGVAALFAAGVGVGSIPLGGAIGALARALALVVVQITAVMVLLPAFGRGRAGVAAMVGVVAPRPGRWALGAAAALGVALWLLGRGLQQWIPATGESAVGAVVAWPSGSLAVALASVASPIVEEVFFRGFVYGVLERRHGRWVAFAATVGIFALAHLPQTWGAWGGFAAVTVTGVALTALRAWSGSVAVPAMAHLVHNGAITLLWVVLSRG